ncbi:MAG: ATP-binding protein [Myxococcales bacterium]
MAKPSSQDVHAQVARLERENAALCRENEALRARDAIDAQLQSDASRYELIVSSLAEGVVVQMADGEIRACNPAAESILGLTFDQMSGRTSADPRWRAIHEDGTSFPGDEHPAMVSLKTGAPVRDVVMGVHKPGGELTWISVSAQPLFHPGETSPYAVVATFTDITAHKLAEAQLTHSQRMEMVGRLAGGVAHDFNNLLTVILGCARIAASDPAISRRSGDALESIREAAERAASLTSQLLTFGRRRTLDLRVVDLTALVQDMGRLLGRVLGDHVRMVTELGDRPLPVRADQAQLEQVLVNLAVNARDAMPDGGTLRIELGTEHLEATQAGTLPPGDYAALHVSDDGGGIAEGDLDQIFDPYFTTKEGGSGLGLATCYGIVTQLGGDMRVRSEVGRGTRFSILLPLSIDAPAPAEAPEQPAPVGRGGRILLVEDDDLVRSVTLEGLRDEGYEVTAVSGGEAALRLLRADPDVVDLLISDMRMPGMTGDVLAGQARQIAPTLPVLFVSGYAEQALADAAARHSGEHSAYLHKPFTLAELAAAVARLLAP